MKNDQNPATAHHTITPRQHPLIYTGAGPIHPVHGPLRSPATKAIAPKGFTFSPFWRAFHDCVGLVFGPFLTHRGPIFDLFRIGARKVLHSKQKSEMRSRSHIYIDIQQNLLLENCWLRHLSFYQIWRVNERGIGIVTKTSENERRKIIRFLRLAALLCSNLIKLSESNEHLKKLNWRHDKNFAIGKIFTCQITLKNRRLNG